MIICILILVCKGLTLPCDWFIQKAPEPLRWNTTTQLRPSHVLWSFNGPFFFSHDYQHWLWLCNYVHIHSTITPNFRINRGIFFLFYISQNSLGGRVRFVISGSAPLRDDVMIFLRCALGCQVDTKNCRVKGKNYLATTWRRTSSIIVDGSQISLQRHFTRCL